MRYQFLDSALLGLPLDSNFQHIVGGGIAGLFLGFWLKQKGIPFTIYEKEKRVGGLLDSYWCEYGLVERAANGFLWSEAIQELCDELLVKILPPSEKSKARFLINNGRFKRFPLNIFDITRASAKILWPSKGTPLTVEEFGHQYFGQKISAKVLEPALMGIYGARLEELSFPAVLPSFAKSIENSASLGIGLWKKRYQERKKKKPKTVGTHSFENGMVELVDALSEYLIDEIVLESEMKELPKNDSVILCTPMNVAARLVGDTDVAGLLENLRFVSMLSCTVFLRKDQVTNMKNGFGCLIPRDEGYRLLGILFNHCIFENRVRDESMVSLTCMMRDYGGDLLNKSDEELARKVKSELQQLVGLEGDIEHIAVQRWEKGIPIHDRELYENRLRIDARLKEENSRVRLFGNYTGQVSIRGMCNEAKAMCEKL